MKTSMDDEEDVLFQDFLYKLKQSNKGRFGRLVQERWKIKYFVLCCRGNQLVLKYYNKKPKQLNSQPKKQVFLKPSFKLEKLVNTHRRAFALEVTVPLEQLCLSADAQSTLDLFTFLLQMQVKLRDNITDNLVEVSTEPSEAFTRIGAKGGNCTLHISPWGLSLALKHSRAILAQWPLKSVRYYESSGQGQFTIQAGMVAPMGEGVYVFHTAPGLDNRLYDAVDHFVINTLDRVKPNQRGTAEEIEDYIREFDCLHSLTVVSPSPLVSDSQVVKLLQDNWNTSTQAIGASLSRSSRSPSPPVLHTSSAFLTLSTPAPSPTPRIIDTVSPLSVSVTSTATPSSLVSNNTRRPLPSPSLSSSSPSPSPQNPSTPRSSHSPQTPRSPPQAPPPGSPHHHPQQQTLPGAPSSPQTPRHRYSPRSQQRRESPRLRGSPGLDARVSGRPPAAPTSSSSRGHHHPHPHPHHQGTTAARLTSSSSRGSPRSSSSSSTGGGMLDGGECMLGSVTPRQIAETFASPPRRHSNPSNVALKVTHDSEIHPLVRKHFSGGGGGGDGGGSSSTAEGMVDGDDDDSLAAVQRHPPNSPRSPGFVEGRKSCPVNSTSPRDSATSQADGEGEAAGGERKMEGPVEDWLVSASCEDLSDHMRAVIFHQRHSRRMADDGGGGAEETTDQTLITAVGEEGEDEEEGGGEKRENGVSEESKSDFKIPMPFTNIKGFGSNFAAAASSSAHQPSKASDGNVRDRSQSLDVNAAKGRNYHHHQSSAPSATPSIRQLRKMVSARAVTKETLRKSLSNPNFLNLGSKERLYQHRLTNSKSTHNVLERVKDDTATKLSAQHKAKSRSLVSLLPSGLRRYLSKESLPHSAPSSSSSPSPDVRHSRQQQRSHNITATTTPTTTAADPENSSRVVFRRQSSSGSLREMTIKGIRFTEQSRSFRKPKGYDRSQSAESNHRVPLNDGVALELNGQAPPGTAERKKKDVVSREVVVSPSGGSVSARNSGEMGRSNGNAQSELRERNVMVNGVRPLPPKPAAGWMMRVQSRSDSQSSC